MSDLIHETLKDPTNSSYVYREFNAKTVWKGHWRYALG